MDNYKLEFDKPKGGTEYWLMAAAASVPATYIISQFYAVHSSAILAGMGMPKLLLTLNQVLAPQLFMLLGVVGMAVVFGKVIDFKRMCLFDNWRSWFIPAAVGLEMCLFIPFALISWFSLLVMTALQPIAPDAMRSILKLSNALKEMLMNSDWSVFLIIAFAAVIVAPIVEEIVFRAVLFNFFSRRLGVLAGVIVTSLIFSVFHLNATSFIVLFLLGVVLQVLYIKTKSIYSCMLFHAVHNSVAILIMTSMKILR